MAVWPGKERLSNLGWFLKTKRNGAAPSTEKSILGARKVCSYLEANLTAGPVKKLSPYELPRLSPAEFQVSRKMPLVIVLDNVRSMHNVGAAFRIADAFLLEKIFLCGITGTPPHRAIHKTALGAEVHVAWEYAEDSLTVVQHLKAAGYVVAAAEQTSKSELLHTFVPVKEKRYAVIFGHEAFGIQDSTLAACDLSLEISQYGVKHSLNVSVSMGIVIWELAKQVKYS